VTYSGQNIKSTKAYDDWVSVRTAQIISIHFVLREASEPDCPANEIKWNPSPVNPSRYVWWVFIVRAGTRTAFR